LHSLILAPKKSSLPIWSISLYSALAKSILEGAKNKLSPPAIFNFIIISSNFNLF